MEDLLVEFLGDSILGDVLEVIGESVLDLAGVSELMASDIALEGASALSEAGLDFWMVSVFPDASVSGVFEPEVDSSIMEAFSSSENLENNNVNSLLESSPSVSMGGASLDSFTSGLDASVGGVLSDNTSSFVQITDPFSDLDGNGLRDSVQLGGLDLDGSGLADSVELNVDIDANGVADSVQSGLDMNGNGVFDQYDISVDSDANGVFDSIQPVAFDLDGNGLKDIASYEDLIKIQSGVSAKWF